MEIENKNDRLKIVGREEQEKEEEEDLLISEVLLEKFRFLGWRELYIFSNFSYIT